MGPDGAPQFVSPVTNNPEVFKVRKKVQRNGKSKVEWVPMRKVWVTCFAINKSRSRPTPVIWKHSRSSMIQQMHNAIWTG